MPLKFFFDYVMDPDSIWVYLSKSWFGNRWGIRYGCTEEWLRNVK